MEKNPSNLERNPYYYDILYGALLYDIGKFVWRADKSQPERYLKLSKDDIGLSGGYSKWSADFYQKYLKGKIFESVHDDIIEALILYHHYPESDKIKLDTINQNDLKKLIKIIQIADHSSSGERIKRVVEEDFGNTRTEVLQSIFSSVKLEKSFSQLSYYSLYPLTTKDHARDMLFPKKSREEAYGVYANDTQPLYKQLYTQFVNELNNIVENIGHITFTTLYNLIFKYTINIPSATYVDISDISLFDQLKTTVVIAACLFLDVLNESDGVIEKISNTTITDHKKKRYLMVQGNISGIQDFIYSIASKGAAKGLKGRSFFVQYLGELISKYILEDLKLPVCCEIYCDGGNFYLIVPSCYEERLRNIKYQIRNNLLEIFNGALFIDLQWISFNRYNLSIDPEGEAPFSSLWANINSLTRKEKFQRYNDILSQSKGFEKIFAPQGSGGSENRICSICKQEKQFFEEENKCYLCKSFEGLTRKLIKTHFILLKVLNSTNSKIDSEIKNINDFSKFFNSEIVLLENEEELEKEVKEINGNPQKYKKVDLILINDTKLGNISQSIKLSDSNKMFEFNLGFDFYSSVIPLEEGMVKDFDKIANDNRTLGDNKIGLVRMDLDNLGQIFSNGIKSSSLSRLSTLSLRLKLFFKFWINEICKGNIKIIDFSNSEFINNLSEINPENENFLEVFANRIKNNIYLVYASGDDLFIIGHWNDIILLSCIIKEIFTTYVGGNPNLTISSGITITHSKFPLYKGAEKAGIAEEKAKLNYGKDSISVLDKVYHWEKFSELNLLKEKLYYYNQILGLKKSFFHRLLQFYDNYNIVYKNALEALKTKDFALVQNKNKINLYYIVDGDLEKTAREAAYYSKWYWRFIYFMKRTSERNEKLKPQLKELEYQIVKGKMIKDLYLPVRWAELITKQKSSLSQIK